MTRWRDLPTVALSLSKAGGACGEAFLRPISNRGCGPLEIKSLLKILASVSQAISRDTPSADLQADIRQHRSLAASQTIDLHTLRRAPGRRERMKIGDVMSSAQVATGDRLVDPMIALAGCSTRQRIVVAGSKSVELMLELHRRGCLLAAAGNCGHANGQYDVAHVDWRRRTLRALETTMDWLMNFLGPRAVLVVWVDAQKPAANESLRDSVAKRGPAKHPNTR
jgi:hypothetical protein